MDGKIQKFLGAVSEQMKAVRAAYLLVLPPSVSYFSCLHGSTCTAQLDACLLPGQVTRRQLEIATWCGGWAARR